MFPVELPPLRKRPEDIPLLVERFLNLLCRKLGRTKPRLTLANVQNLQKYAWPGNVRELQHVIERAVITAEGGRLAIELPTASSTLNRVASISVSATNRIMTDAELRQLEADNIRAALKQSKGKVSGPDGAAELLGMKPTTLASRIKVLGFGDDRRERSNGGWEER